MVTVSGAADQKVTKEQSQAEPAIAGSIGTSRCLRISVAMAATQSVMTAARNFPNSPPLAPCPSVSITSTPTMATPLAISVERLGRSPMKTKATAAVTKGTVA